MNELHDEFETIATKGPLSLMQRPVKTPMPDGPEENNISQYVLDNGGGVKVSKISHLGWSVRVFGHDEAHMMNPDKRFDSEEAAHEKAKELVSKLL